MRNLIYILILTIFISSCDDVYNPKQIGYHKIDLPKPEYKKLDLDLPYSFEHSIYSVSRPHKKSKFSNINWIDVYYPNFDASIELTYKKVTDDKKEFNKMLNDARKLTNKHNIKAYAIDETVIKTPMGLRASVFELEGDVPSQFQFYVTDSTNHFFRGALYFKTAVKNDSLQPIIDYVSVDIVHMLNTLNWNEEG